MVGGAPLGPGPILGLCLFLSLELPSGVLMRNNKVPPHLMTQRAVSPTLGLSGSYFQLIDSHWQLPMGSTMEEPAPNSFNWLQTANTYPTEANISPCDSPVLPHFIFY